MFASLKKISLAFLLVAFLAPFLLSALTPIPALAAGEAAPPSCSIFDGLGEVILCPIGSILTVIQQALGLLVAYLADGTVWALSYGTKVISLPAVGAGFQVTLSLVNLILVMALIIIAFQIILDYHAGDAKSKIPKVIVAAVLINFSYLIAGFLLDISNVFTLFFLKGVTSGAIYNTLDPAQFQSLGFTLGGGQSGVVVGQLFGVFFTGAVLLVLVAVFATAMVRIVYVATLLLLMPLTWGFWVFPGLSKHTKDWWNKFLSWGVTMLPTMTFFIYIALATTAKTRSAIIGPNVGAGTKFFEAILQLVILGGLMIAGLKTANEAGGITSAAAIGGAGKLGGWMAKRRMTQYAAGKASNKMTDWAGSQNNILKRTLGKTAVLTGIAGAAANVAHGREHALEEEAKARYGGMDKAQLIKLARTSTNATEQAKIMLMLSKQSGGIKALGKEDPAALTRLAKAYEAKNGAHKKATDLSGVKDAIKENPYELAQALGGSDYSAINPVTKVRFTQGEAAVEYMKRNGIASGLGVSQITGDVVKEAIANQKFLASIDSNASINAVVELKTRIEAEGRSQGITTARLTAAHNQVKVTRQAVEDEKSRTGSVSTATINARDTAINKFKTMASTDVGKALRYLDQNIRNEP